MKVSITEVSSPAEAMLSLGVPTLLKRARVDMNAVTVEVEIAEAEPALTLSIVQATASVPVKKREAAREKKPAAAAAYPAEGAPRVTIRQRILDLMAKGPVTSADVSRLTGLDIGNSGQHLYLLTKSKLAVRDEESGTWSLA